MPAPDIVTADQIIQPSSLTDDTKIRRRVTCLFNSLSTITRSETTTNCSDVFQKYVTILSTFPSNHTSS